MNATSLPPSIRRIVMTFPHVVLDGDHVIAKGQVTAVRDDDRIRLADSQVARPRIVSRVRVSPARQGASP